MKIKGFAKSVLKDFQSPWATPKKTFVISADAINGLGMHGIDIEAELVRALSAEITVELDKAILADLTELAQDAIKNAKEDDV